MADAPRTFNLTTSFVEQFKLPPAPQSSSRLLTCPTEIRIKILRNLFKKASLVEPCYKFRPTLSTDNSLVGEYKNKYSLSSQSLRCCQEFYHEGRRILYQENVLVIEMGETFDDKMYTLECFIDLPDIVGTLWRQRTYILSIARKQPEKNLYSHQAYTDMPRPLTLNDYATLDRFTNLRLNLRSTDQLQLYIAFFSLQDVVSEKHLTVSNEYNMVGIHTLPSILCLRCKSITFCGFAEHELSYIISVVTSQHPNTSRRLVELFYNSWLALSTIFSPRRLQFLEMFRNWML